MTSPATELKKLVELRDAGEITPAEFEAGKARILRPAPRPAPISPKGPLDRLSANLLTLVVAIGVLVGATTLIALTEAGAIALLSLALVALVLIGLWLFRETFWF
jgi:hypothetical protein